MYLIKIEVIQHKKDGDTTILWNTYLKHANIRMSLSHIVDDRKAIASQFSLV